jgi:hypothetical protein
MVMVYLKKIVCSFLYSYKDNMPILCIYGKCMTQTKSMNHTNITRWRYPRTKLKNLVKICAGFVNRRKTLFND